MRILNKFKKIILILICLSIISCGFHLRGEIKVPEVMRDIFLSGNSNSNNLNKVLLRRFKQLEITRVSSKESASALLIITQNNFTRRVLTVDSATKAFAYKLDLIIGFTVTDPDGGVLVGQQDIRQTREYNIDPNNALASGDQEAQLKFEMVEFIVNQILTRISFTLKNTK